MFSSKENKFLEGYQRGTLHCRAVCCWELLQCCIGHPSASHQRLKSGQRRQHIYYAVRPRGSSAQLSLNRGYSLISTICKVTSTPAAPETRLKAQRTSRNHKTPIKVNKKAPRESKPLSRQDNSLNLLLYYHENGVKVFLTSK